MSRYGAHKYAGPEAKQKGIGTTDDAVSIMIRERDVALPCIVCKEFKKEYDNGHFQGREAMPTRFHPWNCNKEATHNPALFGIP